MPVLWIQKPQGKGAANTAFYSPYYANTRLPLDYGHPGNARGLLMPLLALPIPASQREMISPNLAKSHFHWKKI